jgi:hypothetical protein
VARVEPACDNVQVAFIRQNPGKLSNLIENFSQVKEIIIADGRFIEMIE